MLVGRRGTQHFLDNQLTNGGEVVSLTRLPCFTPQEDSWYLFLLGLKLRMWATFS
jgi:hypothetical protein